MSSTKDNDPSQGLGGLHDPEADEFQSFKTDPRKVGQKTAAPTAGKASALVTELRKRIAALEDEQDRFDDFRLFKREKLQEIQRLESQAFNNRERILSDITKVAEAICQVAFEETLKALRDSHGIASYKNAFQQPEESKLAIVGMGSLGAHCLNYHSDLDVIFVYSHLGESIGKKVVTNREYYSKFAQKWSNLLSVMTGAGSCYDIDFELRPSGNAGLLVSSFDHFLEHQMNKAQNWERMALLRAVPVAGEAAFQRHLLSHLEQIRDKREIPKDFFKDMAGVRQRVRQERANEKPETLNLKLGNGMLMDVDFIVMGLQLKNLHIYPTLRTTNPFQAVRELQSLNFLEPDEAKTLLQAQKVFYTLLSRLHLKKKRSENHLHLQSEDFGDIAADLGQDQGDFKDEIFSLRNSVLEIYKKTYETT